MSARARVSIQERTDRLLPALEVMARRGRHHSGAGYSASHSHISNPVVPRDMNEQEIRARLREWVLAHSKVGCRGEFSDHTHLLESGMLSSLDIVELVLFIEELRGADIETDDIEPEVFTSVDTLWEGFFVGVSS